MKAVQGVLNDDVVSLRRERPNARGRDATIVARLESVREDGLLSVVDAAGQRHVAHWLENEGLNAVELQLGDRLLAVFPAGSEDLVVIGRIGRYNKAAPPKRVEIQSVETLSLRCGEACLDLRADGKVMIRGEDVLVRARGTGRIKAGTVNIN